MLKNKKIKRNWSNEDVGILTWILSKHIEQSETCKVENMTPQDWKIIARLIPGSTPTRCMFKWLSLKKFNLGSYRWE